MQTVSDPLKLAINISALYRAFSYVSIMNLSGPSRWHTQTRVFEESNKWIVYKKMTWGEEVFRETKKGKVMPLQLTTSVREPLSL